MSAPAETVAAPVVLEDKKVEVPVTETTKVEETKAVGFLHFMQKSV